MSEKCPRCDGHGSVPKPGFPRRLGFTCPICEGTGEAGTMTIAQAAELIKEHAIVEVFDSLPNISADLFLRLGNGQIIGFWSACDYGPSYYTLHGEEAR